MNVLVSILREDSVRFFYHSKKMEPVAGRRCTGCNNYILKNIKCKVPTIKKGVDG
jgi:hypothetical protein